MKEFAFKINGAEYKCAVEEIEAGKTKVTVNGKVYEVETEAPKAEQPAPAPKASATSAEPTDEGTKAAIAMSLAQAGDEDIAAIAYALYLACDAKHDIPTAMISLKQHETAWNTKSIGMNNVGF